MRAEPSPLEAFADIPDPAVRVAGRAPPALELPAEPSLTRAEARTRRIAAIVGGVAWVALWASLLGIRPDIDALLGAGPPILWTSLAVIALGLALRPRARGLPPGIRAVQLVLAAVPLAFAAGALAWSPEPAPGGAALGAFRSCLMITATISLGLVGLAATALRGSFLSAPGWRGAAVGVVCGLIGAVGIHLHCPVALSGHVLVAHGMPILLAALAGAGLGALGGRA